ncbi:MAG TPA: DnaJ family domain-containing protein [Verrucomicrobiae bacterium]|nr:DnaJ family domain-containing protein [Verrucomicrobiae bacterium]
MLGAIPIIADNRIRAAMEQGMFDRLEGAGHPLCDLDGHYDPNWWLKRKLQREELADDDIVLARETLKRAHPQRNS